MKTYYGLIGSYAECENEGIFSFELKEDKIQNLKLKASLNNPTYLCNDNRLFSVYSNEDQGGACMLNLFNSSSPIIDGELTTCRQPCHISINSRRKTIFTSNYHTGEIKLHLYSNNKITLLDTYKGNESSKMHFTSAIPKTNKGISIDLGNDELIIFDYTDKISKDDNKSLKLKPGCGPRHLVFHPTKNYIFVLTELSSEVIILKYSQDLDLKVLSYTKTLPNNFTGESNGAAIRITKDGSYIFTSNRGDNSISSLFFNEEDESLTLLDTYSTYGDHPRDFSLTPDDEYLVAANTFSNTLTLYKHNRLGKLTLLQKDIKTNRPTSILFL